MLITFIAHLLAIQHRGGGERKENNCNLFQFHLGMCTNGTVPLNMSIVALKQLGVLINLMKYMFSVSQIYIYIAMTLNM